MKTEIAYIIITDARNKRKDCIISTLNEKCSLSFANSNAKITYKENTILIDDGASMMFINSEYIVSIEVIK